MGEAWEHDSIMSCLYELDNRRDEPQPASTELVNSAITAFALSFPLQSPRIQSTILEQISSFMSTSVESPRDPARRAAINVNVAAALLLSVKVLQGHTIGSMGRFQSPTAEKTMRSILHVSI